MDVKQEYFRLKERCMHASGMESEQADAAMQHFLEGLGEEERQQVIQAVDEDFASLHRKAEEAEAIAGQITLRRQMEAVLPMLSVSALARGYFGKSGSWFYQRLNGNVVHGRQAAFSDDEIRQIADALADLSRKLSEVSDTLCRSVQIA